MPVYSQICLIFLLVFLSAYLSCAEISLASARRSRLEALADEGETRAKQVMALQEHPGQIFSSIQVCTNAFALLGGIVGLAAFSPFFAWCLGSLVPADILDTAAPCVSFVISTLLFVIFGDLLPKRLAVARPEASAMAVVGSVTVIIRVLRPLVFLLEKLSDGLFIRSKRNFRLTEKSK